MKKILFFSLTLLIISFLGSCKKEKINPFEGRVAAEGYVRQLGVKSGVVPNAKVVLYEVKTSGEPFAPVYFIPIGTAITNVDGYYYIDKVVDESQGLFELGAFAKNYLNDYKSLGNPDANFLDPNNFGLNKNRKARHDIGLKPYSWVEVHVKKTNSKDSTIVSISGDWGNTFTDAIICENNIDEEIFVKKILGNDSTKLTYNLINGFKKVYKESEKKYAATHDTVKFLINY